MCSRLNYYLVYTLYGQLLFLVDWWSGSPVTVWCEPAVLAVLQRHRPAESALIIINHHYELVANAVQCTVYRALQDWLYGWAVADRAGLLGHCRAFAKASLRWVPVLGWSSVLSGTHHRPPDLNCLLEYFVCVDDDGPHQM